MNEPKCAPPYRHGNAGEVIQCGCTDDPSQCNIPIPNDPAPDDGDDDNDDGDIDDPGENPLPPDVDGGTADGGG
ncbi:MAG: hypothetical protein HY897_04110, partial [Deltaproteobacteria bacterium]|nr:hypothetical protein [Deltaproteobacteria bacterium]